MVLTRERRAVGRPSERGAILVMAAIVLTTMLTVTALVIDVANARQVRRQAQGAADAAALAGAQDLPDGNAVVATVKAYALRNMDIAATDWNGCTDPEHLAELPDLPNANECISLDEALTKVRVNLPETAVPTSFGKIIGVDKIDVHADAIAEAQLTRDDRIIPATVAAQAGSGNLCIENGGNDVACADRTAGNFGSIDSPRLRLFSPTSNVQHDTLRINYSLGVDHALSIYGSPGAKVCDGSLISPCVHSNTTTASDANHLVPFTGNDVPPLTDGVIENATIGTESGSFLFCGRLKRPDLTDANLALPNPDDCNHWRDHPGPGPSIQVLGDHINGRHVTYWMKPTYRTLFYGAGPDPATTPSTSTAWAAGDNRLDCFMSSYRFDYTGSKGHAPMTEYFIDPSQPINSNGDGTELSLTTARAFLINVCGLDAATVNSKLASLTDSTTFWPMFESGMVTDPRFGMIPVVGNWSNGGSNGMPIVRFWGVYMYRLYPSSTKLKAIDAWSFETALIATDNGLPTMQFGYQSEQPVVHLVG